MHRTGVRLQLKEKKAVWLRLTETLFQAQKEKHVRKTQNKTEGRAKSSKLNVNTSDNVIGKSI